MITWLRKKLIRLLQQSEYSNDCVAADRITHSTKLSNGNPLRLCIYNATGGKIIEISHYDKINDRNYHSLHIITSDEDFGETIGRLIFVELLKKG